MTNTINDSNNRDDSSRSHALPGSVGVVRDRPRPTAVSMMLAAAYGVIPMDHGYEMPRSRKRPAVSIRNDPARPKTKSDLEKLEAARLKRERKAAKKLSQNAIGDAPRPEAKRL